MQKKIIVNKAAYYQIVEMPLICGDFNAYTIVMPINYSDLVTGFMVEALRPDGSTVTDTGEVYDNRCEYVIKNSMYAIPGEVRIRIAPLTENGKLTARELCLIALEDFKGAQEVPTDRIPALTQAVQYAREMGDYAKEQGSKVVSSVAGKTGAVVLDQSDVGLSNVDNTSDFNKPVSKATQLALDDLRVLIGSGGGGSVASRRYSVVFGTDEWVKAGERWTLTVPFAKHNTGYQTIVQRLERKKSDGSFANVMIQTAQCDNGDVMFLSDEPFDGRFTLREDI